MKVGDLVRHSSSSHSSKSRTDIGIVLEIVKIGNDSHKARCVWADNTMCWSRGFYLEVISESR